jgi:hypothetical protein
MCVYDAEFVGRNSERRATPTIVNRSPMPMR